jgi:TPR repeat protein
MDQYAEDRNSITQLELGELFSKRKNGLRDYKQTFKRYKKAAINGSRKAQHRLGTMYARGQGVEQDYVQAYAWCKVAVFQKSNRAKRKLEVLEAKLSFQQLRRGRWFAQDYYDRFVTPRKQKARNITSTAPCQ